MEIIRIFALQIEQAVIQKPWRTEIYIYCATHAKGVHLGKPQVTQALGEIYRPCDLCSALCECCNMSVTAAVA